MAISPMELEYRLSVEVDSFEKMFDEKLKGQTLHKGGSITIAPPSGFNSSHFAEIRKRYMKVGWSSLEYHSDQREGTYVKFTY
jgi:hypothetical protein